MLETDSIDRISVIEDSNELHLRVGGEGDPLRKAQLLNGLSASIRDNDPRSALQHAIEAEYIARTSRSRPLLAESLEQIGSARLSMSSLDAAHGAFNEAMDLYSETGNVAGRARIALRTGMVYHHRGKFAKAMEAFRMCITFCVERGDELRMLHAEALQSIAAVQSTLGNNSSALSLLLQALRLLQHDEEPMLIGKMLNEIGIVYMRLKEHERAAESFAESLAIARQGSNRTRERAALENIGVIHCSTGNFDEALSVFNVARIMAEELRDLRGMASIDIKVGEVHFQRGDHGRSIEWNTRGLEAMQEIGDGHHSLRASMNLARAYAELGNPAKARGLLEQALSLSDESGDRHSMLEALSALASAHEALMELEPAVNYLRRAATLREEMTADERRNVLMELQTQFDVERARRDRELLRVRNEHLQRTLEQKTNELTANALYLAHRTEFLMQLRRRIETLRDPAEPGMRQAIEEIRALVNDHLNPEQNWGAFETQFRQVHHKFVRTLSERYPQLTPTELKICALLKLNLSNRDIAQMMCVSVHNIEMHRYRLRKKLNLSTGDNLASFLTSI